MGNQVIQSERLLQHILKNFYTTQNENNLELDNPCYALFCVVSIKITLAEQDITH